MTTLIGVTVPEVELALATRYAGISIDVAGTPTPVEVFLEKPSVEDFPERVFPSVSILNLGMFPDFPRQHTTDDDDIEEEISFNNAVDPPEREMGQVPVPFRLVYSIDTWHRVRASEERDLVSEVIINRTRPRGFIPQVGANLVDLNAFWAGSLTNLDETETDEVIFHKSLTLEILADVIPTTATVDRKVVTDLIWQFDQTGLLYDSRGNPSLDENDLTTDARFRVLTPDGVEVL